MVNASYVEMAVSQLRGSDPKVATVVGFPLDVTLTSVKRLEASEALRLGAREIDMVLNIGALKSGDRERITATPMPLPFRPWGQAYGARTAYHRNR